MTLELFFDPLIHSLEITGLVFLMMLIIDFINVKVKGMINRFIGKPGFYQYVLTNFLGATPGCLGSFTNVSLYIHGMISFGALTGSMIASSGDGAYVMIAQLGWTAFIVFAILFVLGIIGSYLSDMFVRIFKIKVATKCKLQVYHEPHEKQKGHYFIEHIWRHLIKKHLLKIFLWTFGSLVIVHLISENFDIQYLSTNYIFWVILIAAIVGLLPDSSPHIIFITLFASGTIPLSVLLVNSIVQDGHGLLPMVSFSIKDTLYIKTINFIFGIIVGIGFYLAGY